MKLAIGPVTSNSTPTLTLPPAGAGVGVGRLLRLVGGGSLIGSSSPLSFAASR